MKFENIKKKVKNCKIVYLDKNDKEIFRSSNVNFVSIVVEIFNVMINYENRKECIKIIKKIKKLLFF